MALHDDETNNSIKFGKLLATPSKGDEVVISGISGRYPESANVTQFGQNLFNKIDMSTDDDRRWKSGHPDIPPRSGKIPNIEMFDAGFFGYNHLQASQLDPLCRIFLEVAIEALFDAGVHPSELKGTKTGVFVGDCLSESEHYWYRDNLVPKGFAILGNIHAMIANHLSKFLKLKGPSVICDTACSSSLYALENAYKAIRTGLCDAAIVGGTNLCLQPYLTLQFARLGVLSANGQCRPFDIDGKGYMRSEAISAVFLQKSMDSKRIYSTILHVKTNCDGFKDSGITYPSGDVQVQLFEEFYKECDSVKPSDLDFMEAHGTGTKVGDPEEMQAIDQVFTKDRQTSFLVGSVKSNIGHTEPTAGLCSVTKAIIAFETGIIPPNINYVTPRPEIKGIHEGRLKVVTENTLLTANQSLIGVNAFGFGGGNAHVLLQRNLNQKNGNGIAKDNIPRLVCVSGRTSDAIDVLLDDVIANNVDVEHIRLLQEIFRINVPGHVYRGYTLATKFGEISRSSYECKDLPSNLVVCFGNISEDIIKNANNFLEVPIAVSTLQGIHEKLGPKGLNILSILYNSSYNSILEIIMVHFTQQILIANLIKSCNIVPVKAYGTSKGFSLGVLVSAYFNGNLTLQDATEYAYHIALSAQSITSQDMETKDIMGLMKGNNKIAIKLQENLMDILNRPEILEGLNDSCFNTKTFLENCFENNSTRNILKNEWAFLEIGDGEALQILQKGTNAFKRKNVIQCDGDFNSILISFGRLYEIGFNPQIQNLYPTVEFPVSRGTPMLSPKIKWNHDREWFVVKYQSSQHLREEITTKIMINDSTYTYLTGHVVNGRNLVPATGYLYFVWKALTDMSGYIGEDLTVVFENCKFRRATSLPKAETILELTVQIQIVSGNFEVIEGGETVVSGKIYHLLDGKPVLEDHQQPSVNTDETPHMNGKDVYKELRLRGYNYSGKFRAIHSCDASAQLGSIKWEGNWITFLDNMLQMKILGEDTKLLYVPIFIQRLVIDASRHNSYVKTFSEEVPILPVTISKETGIIRSGYVEIRGLVASSIAKSKYKGTPVIEKYVFVPNVSSLSTEEAIRANMQILLENLFSFKVKVVELIDEATLSGNVSLAETISNVFGDQPAIQPDITVLTESDLQIPNVKVENKKLLTEVDCSLVVGSRILQRRNVLQLAFSSLKENGFILSREALDFNADSNNNKDINIITIFTTEEEKLVLFRKQTDFIDSSLLKISSKDTEFSWVAKLQDEIAHNKNVVIYAEEDLINGVLGMVLCLRRETGGQNIRLVSLLDPTEEFDVNLPFYRDQLSKNLAINIYKNRQWGTYRHLLLGDTNKVEADHCYLNSLRRGDLSSLTWVEGPLSINKKMDVESTLVNIYYSAINFRDVMTAMGKINADSIIKDRKEQECVQGFEFSGLTDSGVRVMGIGKHGACASLVDGETCICWTVPESWTLQQAVTVPVVYATSLLALMEYGKMQPGCSVLIHSGAGGVGLAAIQIAFHVGCTVYTTVGTLEKRQFLLKRFPKLKDHHISNSRSVEFENHIMKATEGRGVDIVLNSLAEEKLMASVRCLAKGGRFVEIGKFDMANNNTLQLMILEKEASFHGVMLDKYAINRGRDQNMFIHKLLQDYLDLGAVVPLPENMFKINEEEAAFRFMTTGKHIGKVFIQIREETESSLGKKFPCIPRYYCDPAKTYIICGGLGGFGLELADWLILRGCRNLVLTSRTGVKTGYQAYRLSIWKSYGCTIKISTDDITTHKGCINLIKTSSELGPIHAIFNLAVILKDAIFENQSAESFKISFGPKADATQYLDTTTRDLCPELRDFVIFSSVSCGRGNAGQTNYGMANAVMEKICEKRKNDGLPALAIQWGAVGDVGLVADMQEESVEMEIGGTLQQRISNCLEVMDILLKQNEAVIVSSMVVAEKRSSYGGSDSIVDTVAAILGIKDLKSIPLQASLTEIGMDSMTAVEIKQTLDREHDVVLSAQDLKQLTFAKLLEIQAKKESEMGTETGKKENRVDGMGLFFQYMPSEEMCKSNIVEIPQIADNFNSTVVFLPGVESSIKSLEPLYQNTMANLVGIQYPYIDQTETVEETALAVLPAIEERISKNQPFNLVCHSFGCFVGLSIANLLEQKGYCGTLICIDGAPNYLKAVLRTLDIESEEFQVKFLVHNLAVGASSHEVDSKQLEALYKCNSFEERIRVFQSITPLDVEVHSADHQNICILNTFKRLKAMVNWKPSFKLQSKIIYFKASVLVGDEIPDQDLGLSNLCESPVDVKVYEGNHSSVLRNPEVAEAVNEILGLTQKSC
ncbi:unnamed protein product [Ceutorhynchus assimilis]|uniref:oleoyl-[acyl-carrier-protein] hydrolase n=1 Tax=Ceutorhynchus assimilis TaxID=467358 RepID=A0A9P0DF32_9CUCU|nr:unnamed protein product [Ceutorhynchus assimilis]